MPADRRRWPHALLIGCSCAASLAANARLDDPPRFDAPAMPSWPGRGSKGEVIARSTTPTPRPTPTIRPAIRSCWRPWRSDRDVEPGGEAPVVRLHGRGDGRGLGLVPAVIAGRASLLVLGLALAVNWTWGRGRRDPSPSPVSPAGSAWRVDRGAGIARGGRAGRSPSGPAPGASDPVRHVGLALAAAVAASLILRGLMARGDRIVEPGGVYGGAGRVAREGGAQRRWGSCRCAACPRRSPGMASSSPGV